MRFSSEHRFDGSEQAVLAILSDPEFYVGLTLPDLSVPEVLEHVDGDEVLVRLRYQFVGSLDPIARRLIGSARLVLIQEVRIDRPAASGTVRLESERDPRRLHGATDFVLSTAGTGTVWRLEGEVVVAIPGIGRMAERRIMPGVVRRLDIEARAVDERLRQGE